MRSSWRTRIRAAFDTALGPALLAVLALVFFWALGWVTP